MKFMVRQALPEDAPGIASVQVESWKTTYAGIVPDAFIASLTVAEQTLRWQEPLVARSASIFVAEDQSGIFGFAAGGAHREALGDYDTELYAIYLFRDRQQQGAGRALVGAVAEALRAQGFHRMLVWVLEQNPAVEFYSHLGAIEVAQKFIEIGGVSLPELALGWPTLEIAVPKVGRAL
jgi:GNAT superfamily N-acetyltransferase